MAATKAASETKASAPSEYVVKTAVKHDGKTLKPGAKITLTERQAKHLKGALEAAK